MVQTHILGFPRMGIQRELKFSLEKYWRGEIEASALEEVAVALRSNHWQAQKTAGLDFISVGDFAYYDQVANHIALLGCVPKRFIESKDQRELDRYFCMARGGSGIPALEMTKWFDTNYHYLVPEFDSSTEFNLNPDRLMREVTEATQAGHRLKAVLIGPLTFLWLGKSYEKGFDRLSLLQKLLPVYKALLKKLKEKGVDWVQIDEPILGLDLTDSWQKAFIQAYQFLYSEQGDTSETAPSDPKHDVLPKALLTTYFSSLRENLELVCKLPVAGLHVDAVRCVEELPLVSEKWPMYKVLSIGVVDGRNIWRCSVDAAIKILEPLYETRGSRLWVGTSCSLLHVPMSLRKDSAIDVQLSSWLSGALEKLDEISFLKRALVQGKEAVGTERAEVMRAIEERRNSPRVKNQSVCARIKNLGQEIDRRKSSFVQRQKVQRLRLQLPSFPTTTIGSFPQTSEIRSARAHFKKGTLSEVEYRQAMQKEIAFAVSKQEALDLDVLVHGEAERNDMVEYFGEQLEGFAFSANGWVQSYGSRCVKPPILFGDVSRPKAMTVEWAVYAQELTQKPMKGMLTGPVTILQWSFVRDDQPRSETALQIALAIRDEVCDLEAAGIGVIQIDEPAIREGLPLRRSDWSSYLQWAARVFRISASGVRDDTQIHTHMCYSEFNDILPEIASMDADVITIETSRSAMELLNGFGDFKYPNEIGPGVYDIHSPRIPSLEEMQALLEKAVAVIPWSNLWVNPDCGLKTRNWDETEKALKNMVGAAKVLRARFKKEAD